MKLPKRISQILKQKQEFIDRQNVLMNNTAIKAQSQLLSDIITELIPQLDVKDGVIQETSNNYRLLSVLDKTYKNANIIYNQVLLTQVVSTTTKLAKLNTNYYEVMLSGSLPAKFEKIVATTDKLINAYIGIDGQKLTKGGFLESYFSQNVLNTELKQLTAKAVTSNMDIREYTKILKDKITGTDEYKGGIERQINQYVTDLYQTYDQAYNKTIGNELGLTYFVYQGGLVDDSRDFCAAHNNKVWSIEESESWATWTPAQGEYPAGYEVKAKDLYSVPSYLGYAGYDPLINLGGYRCRHWLGWVTDDIAIGMRPDLKEVSE
jgi:hypothetical protein